MCDTYPQTQGMPLTQAMQELQAAGAQVQVQMTGRENPGADVRVIRQSGRGKVILTAACFAPATIDDIQEEDYGQHNDHSAAAQG